MWDVMIRDKEGIRKEHSFAAWCKRIALICDAHNSAAAQTSAAASGAATEHAKQDIRFRKLAAQVVALEFTSEQKQEPDYQIIPDKSISSPLRSTIRSILRKNLGDARVMDYIFDHHIPELLDPPLHVEEHMLDKMLDDFMIWHSALLRWIVLRQQHPSTRTAQKLADLNQKEWQAERRRNKAEAKSRLRQGEDLAALRDSKKKRAEDMSATEQQILEDFDTQKLREQYENQRIEKTGNRLRKAL